MSVLLLLAGGSFEILEHFASAFPFKVSSNQRFTLAPSFWNWWQGKSFLIKY